MAVVGILDSNGVCTNVIVGSMTGAVTMPDSTGIGWSYNKTLGMWSSPPGMLPVVCIPMSYAVYLMGLRV